MYVTGKTCCTATVKDRFSNIPMPSDEALKKIIYIYLVKSFIIIIKTSEWKNILLSVCLCVEEHLGLLINAIQYF
jgi:hypothetical protein